MIESLLHPTVPVKRRVLEYFPSTSAPVETSTPIKPKFEIDNEEDGVEEEFSDFGRKNFGEVASPSIKPYLYNGRFLYKQYGIRREDDGSFMTSRGLKFRDVISKLFLRRGGLAELKFHYGNTGRRTDMVGNLYFGRKAPASSRP